MRTNDAQILVLCTLADGPLHGYAINTAIERLSGRSLGAGSLYGALSRLEAKGFVEPLEGPGRRRPVRLTEEGRAVLEREAHAMARVTERVFETAAPDPVAYLDRVAGSGTGRHYKSVMLELLGLASGLSVLDLGCGPGTDLAALAEGVAVTGPGSGSGPGPGSGPGLVSGPVSGTRTAPGPVSGTEAGARETIAPGTVLGIDADEEMVTRARERTAGLGTVEVLHGDAGMLPLGDATADRARTDRVLQHVEDPGTVLAEARRVLRPGGRLVMGEPDWDSLAIDHPDLEISRAYTRHITDRIVRNGVVGRQLARLAADAGFLVPDVVPVTSLFRDVRAADEILGLHRGTERAVAAGYLTEGAARSWLDHLENGDFLAAVTLYVVVAEVPR
ncbi:methyltransferase domain-containing protein [Streptomyces sp. CAU 1734]|uniref:methyltransferase domain-containing protein n=1 Tax=Streptomyces sp. CAU 1734 TaxID=3140360 RepID=UPI003260D479